MASQMIWLLGYVSLGLALTLGNRPVHNHVQVRSRFDHRAKVSDSTITGPTKELENELPTGPYDLPPDWVAYQARDLLPRHQFELENSVDYDSALDDFATALDTGLLELSQSRRGPRAPTGVGTLEGLPVSGGVDLNEQLIDRPGLATTTLKGSSLWSLGPIDYPWKAESRGSVETNRLAKRNQVAGRRRLGDSRSAPQPVGGQPPPLPGIPPEIGGMASQFMLRAARGNRQYDVPQIECPSSEDGMERFACPTPDRMGRYRCIDDHVLCDGFIDCPTGEDEDRQACMFYKTTKAHLDVLAEALLRWVRGR